MATYAGIGSRKTPPEVLAAMRDVARHLAALGWALRSGAADGADAAFEVGCDDAGGMKEIYIPWRGFNGSRSLFCSSPEQAFSLAQRLHPAWAKCSPGAKKLHARNVLQILGGDLKSPCDAVIAWTPGGALAGGTATALLLAGEHGIPVINLGSAEWSCSSVDFIVAALSTRRARTSTLRSMTALSV